MHQFELFGEPLGKLDTVEDVFYQTIHRAARCISYDNVAAVPKRIDDIINDPKMTSMLYRYYTTSLITGESVLIIPTGYGPIVLYEDERGLLRYYAPACIKRMIELCLGGVTVTDPVRLREFLGVGEDGKIHTDDTIQAVLVRLTIGQRKTADA